MNSMQLDLKVNGETKHWTIAPGDLLLDVLRREGYFGVKRGCESGECGACTVLVNGKPINSCLMFAAQAEGCEILTIEGVEHERKTGSPSGSFFGTWRRAMRVLHAGNDFERESIAGGASRSHGSGSA